ncbi:MAG: hypothetical protein IKP10_00585 [Clostridia bacterium]|nr:hypothetical protein [Clostridia bacterium]
MRELTPAEAMGRALNKRWRKPLWQPFVAACKRYGLTRAGDRIAAVLDGSAEALCAAALLRELQRHSEVPFTLYVCPAPGTGPAEAFPERTGFALIPYDEAMAACNVRTGTVTMSEVCETLLASMLREGSLHAVPPRAETEDGRVLIQPLYCAERRDVGAWCRASGLPCRTAPLTPDHARMRELIDELRRDHPNAEISLFRAVHAVRAGTFPHRND